MWEKEKGRKRGGGYEFVDSVDEAECFLRGVSLWECGEGVWGSVYDCFHVVCGSGISDEGTREPAVSGQRSAVSGGCRERGGVIILLHKGSRQREVLQPVSHVSPPARRPPAGRISRSHFFGLFSPTPARMSVSLFQRIGQSVSQSVKPTSALSAPPHHRPLQVSVQAREVPSIAPSIP